MKCFVARYINYKVMIIMILNLTKADDQKLELIEKFIFFYFPSSHHVAKDEMLLKSEYSQQWDK